MATMTKAFRQIVGKAITALMMPMPRRAVLSCDEGIVSLAEFTETHFEIDQDISELCLCKQISGVN